jgi:hypothetical protein
VGLVLNSITVQGGAYTLQGPAGADHVLTVAAGASIDTQNGSTLAVCPDRLTGTNKNSISLNLLGGTIKSGTGILLLNNDIVRYVSPQAPLQPFHVTGGTVTLGADVNMYQSLVQLDTGTKLVVSDQFKPTVGNLSGSGTLQIGVNPGHTDLTGLFFDPPQAESDVFSGAINGPGGTLYMAGDGSLTIGSINTSQSGLFDVSLASGTLLANGAINAHQLVVTGSATFGGPATMNFSGTVTFISGSTFAPVFNGTATGQFTRLTDSDTTDPSPVNLGGGTLSLSLGFIPPASSSFTLISSPNGLTGQFANAINGQPFTVNGVSFNFNASSTTVTLAVPSVSAPHLVVTSPPPGTIAAGTAFGLTVKAVDSSGNVEANYNGVVTATASPGGATFTATASQGVATFSGLIFNNVGTYTLQLTAGGLASAMTSAINVTSSGGQPPPPAPTITGESVLITRKLNKKHKPVGKPILTGYTITFSTAMDQTALANVGNYQVAVKVIKKVKVGKKKVPQTVLQPFGFSVSQVTSNSVTLNLAGTQKFAKGGQITVLSAAPTGVDSAANVFLAGNGILSISAGGKSISLVQT